MLLERLPNQALRFTYDINVTNASSSNDTNLLHKY
jgi:hypothetical protein